MLLLLALLATPPAVAAVNMSTVPCASALCENLTIAYPFWLAGTHPPECGYRAFVVACDKGNVLPGHGYLLREQLLQRSGPVV